MLKTILENFRFTNQERELQAENEKLRSHIHIIKDEKKRNENQSDSYQTSLRLKISEQKAKIADLGNQVEELRAGKPLSADDTAIFRNQAEVIRSMQKQENLLALWLRNNRKREIENGEHSGMTLVQVIVRYLARGLQYEHRAEVPLPIETALPEIPGTGLSEVEKQALKVMGEEVGETPDQLGFGSGSGKAN